VFIITGGGSGIGRCTAHELAQLGGSVALVGRNVDKLKLVEKEIVSSSGTCSVHACDIRDESDVQSTVSAILERHGRIDGLLNNAGGQFQSPLKDISRKGWEAVVNNNLTGGFLFSRECYNQWMVSNGGSIVNIIADMWGGMPNMGHSGAARAGMLNFTETAALEWAPVRVNAVAPGFINSSGVESYPKEIQELMKELQAIVPLRRLGTESEVSSAITFLLSPASAFTSGMFYMSFLFFNAFLLCLSYNISTPTSGSGSCLRVDGAAPNAKRIYGPQVGAVDQHGHPRSPDPFDGFHMARKPLN